MAVSLFIGMLLNTFARNALEVGGFTQALTNVGFLTILAMYLFTAGTKMTLCAAPMLKRGFGILFANVGIPVASSSSSSARFGCASLRCTTSPAVDAGRVVSVPGPTGGYSLWLSHLYFQKRTYS